MEKAVIKKAEKADHKELTKLVKKSKAYWGYTPSQLEEWDNELTITPNYISSNAVFKYMIDECLIGCYSYLKLDNHIIELDYFFISSIYIGKGCGKLLMLDFLERIKKEKIKKIIVNSDPNAERFYSLFGFKTVKKIESSIKGRFLPKMEKYI